MTVSNLVECTRTSGALEAASENRQIGLGSYQTPRFEITFSLDEASSGRSKIGPLLGWIPRGRIWACAETTNRPLMAFRGF